MQDALTSRAGPVERSNAADTQDAALVVRAQADRQAFALLYDRYLDPVYRYCAVRLGSREAAEDATSLIFTKALDGIAGQRGASFRSWLFAIAHNVVTDHYRASHPAERLDAAQDLIDPSPAPDDLATDRDLGRAIRTALQRLSPDQRDVVELRLAGLTGPEIAQALGKSHAAVRIAQFRGYNRLRSLLGDAWKETTDGSNSA